MQIDFGLRGSVAPIRSLLCFLIFVSGSTQWAAAEPAGYEFFDTANGNTIHFQNMPVDVVKSFAPNSGFLSFPGATDPEFRLIDIEIEKAGPKSDDWEFSGIFLENKGKYDRQSWMFYNLTADEVMQMAEVSGWMPIDIEHRWYAAPPSKDVTQVLRYAVIFAECPEKYEYSVILDGTQADLESQVRRGFRPLEMDPFDESLWQTKPQHLNLRFDAVFVENVGSNYVDTRAQYATAADLGNLVALGYQVIDFERLDSNQDYFMDDDILGHFVLARNNNLWWLPTLESPDIHKEEESPHLRLVDLEPAGGDSFATLFAHQLP